MLYISENDIAGARGVIGIYDVAREYRKIGEHSSYGTGPHEIMLLADGKTIAVGNGGLDTVPDAGRVDLNIETMQPSLAFVDAGTGALIAKHAMTGDLKSLSIRHVTQDAKGVVWFGGQWEGSPSETPQIVGSAGPDRALKLVDAPGGGKICAATSARWRSAPTAVSSPQRTESRSRPYVDTETGNVVGKSNLKDVCGLASEGSGDFAALSGFGVMRYETPRASVISEVALSDIAFDNHLRRVVSRICLTERFEIAARVDVGEGAGHRREPAAKACDCHRVVSCRRHRPIRLRVRERARVAKLRDGRYGQRALLGAALDLDRLVEVAGGDARAARSRRRIGRAICWATTAPAPAPAEARRRPARRDRGSTSSPPQWTAATLCVIRTAPSGGRDSSTGSRRGEDFGAEGLAVAGDLLAVAVQRRRHLGPVGVAAPGRRRRRSRRAGGRGGRRRSPGRGRFRPEMSTSCCRLRRGAGIEQLRGRGRDHVRLAARLTLHLGIDAVAAGSRASGTPRAISASSST